MSADPADVQRATRRAQVVTLADGAIQTAFPAARDAINAPDRGYFENPADALAALAIKATLVGTFRRRFVVQLTGEYTFDPATAIPTMTLIDAEADFSGPVFPARLLLDMENEVTGIEVVG